MNLADRRARFRAVLSGSRCVRPGSVFDPLSARIAEDLGYEVGMLAGSTASLAVLGAPDIILLTLSEFADQARRIARASELPLMVDADHGYGNALNVMRCVEELTVAGVSGMSIEDTELPPPHGAQGEARLLSLEEGLGKMRAAVAAKTDPAVVVAGRTSAVAIAGLDECVRRVERYAASGVDALFLVGLERRAELEAVRAVTRLPLIISSGSAELADVEYLAAQGVRLALQGHAPIRAGYQAVYDTLAAEREGREPERRADPALIDRITRRGDYTRWSEDFL